MTDDGIWNEDGTPKPEATQAARLKLRGILKDWYGWKQKQVDKIVPEKLPELGENVVVTRETAVDAAIESWEDDMRKTGWTEAEIEEFLRTH